MPAEKSVPYPDLSAEDFEASEGSREQKGARCVAARCFGGIPTRAFLLGDNDHSPMMKGVIEFTGAVYELLDRLEPVIGENGGAELDTAARRVHDMLTDHGCGQHQPPSVQRGDD